MFEVGKKVRIINHKFAPKEFIGEVGKIYDSDFSWEDTLLINIDERIFPAHKDNIKVL